MQIIREIVAGKQKKRTIDSGYNLDLSYICPRIIAMSYPGEGLEKTYRNNINDVSNFLNERHGDDYYVYNLSGRQYDINKFKSRVSSYKWIDHNSPPMYILFEVAHSINEFLTKKQSNVVVLHCLAGKGRTGTAICCYLLFSGRFKETDHVLDYYMKKRFYQGGGVKIPSQIRYIRYFESLLSNWQITPVVKYIQSISFVGIPIFSKHSCRPFVEIYNIINDELKLVYTNKKQHKDQNKYKDLGIKELNIFKIQIDKPVAVIGDILFRFYHNGKFKNLFMFKTAFNTAFIPDDNTLLFELSELDPRILVNDKRFPEYFSCEVKFTDFCKCKNTDMFESKCFECAKYMNLIKKEWNIIHNVMKEYDQHTEQESKILLFGDPDFDDCNEVLYTNKSYTSSQNVEEYLDSEFEDVVDSSKQQESPKQIETQQLQQTVEKEGENINLNQQILNKSKGENSQPEMKSQQNSSKKVQFNSSSQKK